MKLRRTLPGTVLFTLLTVAALGLVSSPPSVQARSPAALPDDERAIALERAALIALYEATDGPNWTDSANWLSDRHVAHWRGVSVNDVGQVVGLDLARNRLDGHIPASIGQLAQLRHLALWGNKLSGQIPSSLSNLHYLNQLFVYDNLLSGQLPVELMNLPNLRRLFVGGNRFVGCAPDAHDDTLDNDLATLGLPICGPSDTSYKPPFAIKAFSHSPNEISLTWSPAPDGITLLEVHRLRAFTVLMPASNRTHTQDGLEPNTPYEYELKLKSPYGSVTSARTKAMTLAEPFHIADLIDDKSGFKLLVNIFSEPDYGPGSIGETESVSNLSADANSNSLYMTGPIDVTKDSFKLAINTAEDSPYTAYQVTLLDDWGPVFSTGWETSRCITFDGLQLSGYRYKGVSRERDGLETPIDPTFDGIENARYIYLQRRMGNDDPWSIARIKDAAAIYNLTESARHWMVSDIHVEGMRNEPGYAGYRGSIGAGIGYPVGPGTLMHEVMHGYWEHWDEFSEPCDSMNIYTFRRNVARFMFDFRKYEHSEEPNPLGEWRPFYNYLVGISRDHYRYGDRNFWKLLSQGNYDELWDALYHLVDTEIPSITAGKPSLIPPPLRPYFEGFISDGEDTTWHDELLWYINLPYQERRLWDTAYKYNSVIAHSRRYHLPPDGRISEIPPDTRKLLRDADRRILVDFINTLEDISCNTQDPCQELWNADFYFWTRYVEENLYRSSLYLDELAPSVGIELEQSNWEAVHPILRELTSYLHCQPEFSAAREYVNASEGVSDLQRAAFLQMLEVLDRSEGDIHVPRC